MADIIALHPIEFRVQVEDCTQAMVTAMMAPVLSLAEKVQALAKAEGMPEWRTVRVTVHTSEALTEALAAEGAFDLIVEYDQ